MKTVAKKLADGRREVAGWTLEKIADAAACGQGVRRYFWAATHPDGRSFNAPTIDDAKFEIEMRMRSK